MGCNTGVFFHTKPGQAGTKKYLPPRHKDTNDFILLFFFSVLVPWWQEKKVNAEFRSQEIML
jgi:hypothetical protein